MRRDIQHTSKEQKEEEHMGEVWCAEEGRGV